MIQSSNVLEPEALLVEVKERMIEKHLGYIRQAKTWRSFETVVPMRMEIW